jgi:hypothetical protein
MIIEDETILPRVNRDDDMGRVFLPAEDRHLRFSFATLTDHVCFVSVHPVNTNR